MFRLAAFVGFFWYLVQGSTPVAGPFQDLYTCQSAARAYGGGSCQLRY